MGWPIPKPPAKVSGPRVSQAPPTPEPPPGTPSRPLPASIKAELDDFKQRVMELETRTDIDDATKDVFRKQLEAEGEALQLRISQAENPLGAAGKKAGENA